MSEESNGVTRVYACGGMGINNALNFYNKASDDDVSVVKPAFIDASRSNLTEDMHDDDVFVLENVDGSGKVRRENHKEISNVVKQIVVQMPPGDFNVILSSASGGTGSVVSVLIAKELLDRGESVALILVGSDESAITANNTLNTLKSFDSIARRAQRPIPMFYEHNDGRPRSEVDAQVRLVLSCLAIMASKRNREMDSKDISNWSNFTNTTSVEARLAQFEVFNENSDAENVDDPIAAISIYNDPDDEAADIKSEYHAAGYLRTPSEQFDRLHFIIHLNGLANILRHLTDTIDMYRQKRESRVAAQSISNDDDDTSDDGIVL